MPTFAYVTWIHYFLLKFSSKIILNNPEYFCKQNWNKTKLKVMYNMFKSNFVGTFFRSSCNNLRNLICFLFRIWDTDLNRSRVTWKDYKTKNYIEKIGVQFWRKQCIWKHPCSVNFSKKWRKPNIIVRKYHHVGRSLEEAEK